MWYQLSAKRTFEFINSLCKVRVLEGILKQISQTPSEQNHIFHIFVSFLIDLFIVLLVTLFIY